MTERWRGHLAGVGERIRRSLLWTTAGVPDFELPQPPTIQPVALVDDCLRPGTAVGGERGRRFTWCQGTGNLVDSFWSMAATVSGSRAGVQIDDIIVSANPTNTDWHLFVSQAPPGAALPTYMAATGRGALFTAQPVSASDAAPLLTASGAEALTSGFNVQSLFGAGGVVDVYRPIVIPLDLYVAEGYTLGVGFEFEFDGEALFTVRGRTF